LQELGQGTVEFVANFDGTLSEPSLLPSRLPHILLNSTQGIAVGMATDIPTDIPPHNLREIGKACIHLLDKPRSTLEDIMEYVEGPDYPSAAEVISSPEDIRSI